ncbi:Ku protein [Brevirhabdus pacifica]|uniref:Non-homologous end joining protein Ku n=1 Tax=Brevirhabdus pacifica TaxID=1267768 RepID=A0A1U7DKD3_9RHOB|nr:Ku protein [Brevirhabdus pacifica]APX90432.1 Ku protein [Brevirhabdus pacifica]OWU78548.1 DNA repair protein [Loktanella sp. 22II-4b]PJJ85471.1 DNA end-binding protein Ku [Brevirhabdus pacifica]
MASRPVWKGQLRLSLVSIPIEIHSASKTGARVSFRQIHGPSGQRVRYEKTVPGVGPVDASEIMKGYETGDDEYLLIEPEEIDAIRLETKKTFELVQFVGACEIPPLYFDKPYYIVPSDDLAEDAYRVVRDALRQAEKVGLGQMTMRGKEYLCAVKPCGDGLLLETLFYGDEIREAEPLFSQIADEKADDDLLAVATQLIEKKTAPFNPEAFEDHYDKALRELIASKRRNSKTPRARPDEDAAAPKGGNVVDLMAALKESLAGSGGGKTGAKGSSGSKSAGSKGSKAPAKAASKPASKPASKSAATKSGGRSRKAG